MTKKLHRLALLAAIISLCVIVLGAWVRLSHAGLGCPDWPGCYGQLTWPDAPAEVVAANEAFPERPVEIDKAWKEMVHRYLAGALVLLVVFGTDWSAPFALAVTVPIVVGFGYWFLPRSMALWVVVEYLTDRGNREPWTLGRPPEDPP